MHTFMQGKIKNIHVYNTVMKFVYRHVYTYCNNFVIRKSIEFQRLFMYPIKKDEKSLSTKGKCINVSTMYNVLIYYETS